MSAMDHAAAHERIEYLLLEPARMRALAASDDPEDVALRDHVDACRACRADLEAWGRLQRRVAAALPPSADEAAAAVGPIEAPPSLRANVIAKVREEPRAAKSVASAPSRRPSRLAPLLAMAAALILVVGPALVVLDQAGKRTAAEAETAALTTALGAVDRVLAAPRHVVVQLHRPDGTSAGSISWSRHDWVVITNALARPPTGQTYMCWLVEDDSAQVIGEMQFAGSTAFWAASVDRWATWEIKPTTRFVVTLQPEGSTQLSGPSVLEAALGA